MPRRKRTWSLIIASLLFVAVVAWIGTHSEILTPYLTELASRQFMRGVNGELQVESYQGDPTTGLTLVGVQLNLYDKDGGTTVVGLDSLVLDYDLPDLLRSPLRLKNVEVYGLDLRIVQGGDGVAGSAPSPEAPIFGLPALRIEDLVLNSCSVHIADAAGRLVEELPNVAWRGSVQADSVLTLVSRDGDIDWSTHQTRIKNPQGVVRIHHDRIVVRQLTALFNGHQASLAGERAGDGDLDILVRVSDVSTGEVEDLIDMTLGFAAQGDVTLALKTDGNRLNIDIDYDGEIEGYQLEEFQGRAVLADSELKWSNLAGRINGALFSGTGEFDVRDPDDVIMHLAGNVADVDLSRNLVPNVDLPETDGWGYLDLWRREHTDETSVRGWLRDGHVALLPFDTLYAEVDVDTGGVDFRVLDLAYLGQKAGLTGHADLEGVFNGRLEIDAPDLTRLPTAWNVPPLRGGMQAAGEVSGLDPVYDFVGTAELYHGGVASLEVETMTISLSISDLLSHPSVKADASGTHLRVAGVPLGEVRFRGSVTDEYVYLDHFRSVHGDTIVRFRGHANLADSLSVFQVPELAVDLEGSHWSLLNPLQFRTGDGRFVLEDAELRSRRGHLKASLGWDRRRDELTGSIDVSRLDLDLINPFVKSDVLNGEFTAVCELGGTYASPAFTVVARLEDCDLPLATIDSLTVDATYRSGYLDIHHLDLHSDFGKVTASGSVVHPGVDAAAWWPDAALDLHLDIGDGDWAFLDQFAIPSLDRIAGVVEGSLDVGGTTSEPEIQGGLESAPFHIHWLHFDELRGNISYLNHTLTLSGLDGRKEDLSLHGRLEIPLELDLLSEPVSPLDGPLFMSVTIPDGSNLAPLASMTNAFVMSGGTGALDLVVSGRADHPYYSGSVRVRDGTCVIRKLSEVYHDVSVDGIWQGDVLTLSDLHGREGQRGTIAGGGEVVFSGLELESFDIAFDADRFLVASVPELRALIKGDGIHLRGVKVGPDSLLVPRFEGDLEIIEALYLGDFSEQPSVNDPRMATVAPDWLADLDITAPPRSAKISNRTMELFLGGEVKLMRDMDGLNVLGEAAIDQGHLPVFNNDFQVTRGTADFSTDFGVVPRLDIEAETEVRLPRAPGDPGSRRLERIWITVSGSAQNPIVDYHSESGYPKQNIERMLLGLSPHATDTQTTSVIRTQTMAAGFNLLEREVAQSLNMVDTFDIISGREREDGTTQTLIGVGKYIGRDLFVKFAQAVTDTDREVIVEYMISDHLLLQSEISRRQYEALGNTTYSMDLKYRFEY